MATTLEENIFDRRELPELAGRELLTHAYQKSVKPTFARFCNFSDGCLLTDFIENLFALEYGGLVCCSLPDNIPSSNRSALAFREAFKNARLRFTHFARASDQTVVTTNAMWAAYVRGFALMFTDKHRVADCIIPVLWDACLCAHVMTGLFIRFKRGLFDIMEEDISQFFNASGDDEVCKHANNASLASEVDFGLRRYIALTMDLRFRPRQAARSEESDCSSSSMSPASPSTQAITEKPAPKKSHHITSPDPESKSHRSSPISNLRLWLLLERIFRD